MSNVTSGSKSMRVLLACLAVLAMGPMLHGCRASSQKDSSIQYLTNGDYTCADPGAARLAEVKSRAPNGFISGYPTDQMPVVWSRLALIPDRDLNYLIGNFKAGILKGITPGFGLFGVAGLTTLSYGTSPSGRAGMVASSITTAATMAGFALQHEIGHAVEILAIDAAAHSPAYQNFDADTAKLYQEVLARSDTRAYAKSSASEAWAESYANFYCSPQSHAFIQQNLAYTYGFLSAVLDPPVWEAASSATPTAAAGNTDNIVANDGAEASTTSSAAQNPFQSYINKILGFLGGGATNSSNAVANTTTAAGGTPEAGSAEIALALQDIPGPPPSTGVIVASQVEIKKIILCIGTQESCAAEGVLPITLVNSYLFDNYNTGNGRNFFKMKFISAAQEKVFDSEWHLAGYDASGKLVATRALTLKTFGTSASGGATP